MKYNISLFLGLISLGVIYFITSDIKKELTESRYILGTYMYILLGILLSSLTWELLDNYVDTNVFYTSFNLFGTFMLAMMSLYIVINTTNNVYIIKNIAWLIFIISISIISYLTYANNIAFDNIQNVLIEFVGIIAVLSYVAYSMPVDAFESINTPLLYILIMVIFIECLDYIVHDDTHGSFLSKSRIFGWVSVILFSGYVLYDTQKILSDAKSHTIDCLYKSQLECVDYPVASLGLILDFMGLFSGLSGTQKIS